ncbi:4-hydroxy-tetrahydrodipicolinate reductase [Arenimonas sp.]|uniref:4-hydroxy-tetrahydrodipicolinate reductase n=1 Tax=Arenimonas sp. TaxID=1872635 RepID=UPI0039E29B40
MEKSGLRILIHGASGRMGRALLRLARDDARLRIVAAVSRSGGADAEADVPTLSTERLDECGDFDVAIDFSLPEGFDAILELCRSRGRALVSGTTGLSDRQREAMAQSAQAIPLIWASNFSLGVAVLEDLVARAAGALPDWPVRIIETHHVHKLDAPSGTALTLARASEAGSGKAAAIESIREGEVVGDHLVVLAGPAERIELRHSALNRDIFAAGALEAALRLAGRPPRLWRLPELMFMNE